MTLATPVAMSVVGDAEAVRHLRANGASWAVWLINDAGQGQRFVVRQRTGVISLVATLRTDGADFSERIVPLPPTKVTSYHAFETSPGVVTFLFSDDRVLKSFTWAVATNLVLTPVTVVAEGSLPSQYISSALLRQFYVRDRDVKVRVAGGGENTVIDPTGTEALDQDVVRKAASVLARYAGLHSINRDLALPFLPDATTVLCYNGTTDTVAVTEALPPGVVSYYTFDAANFSGTTMLDQVGANNATLAGTEPASVAGQVNQARQFLTGTGSGHYDAGNPVNLRITGDLSLAYWLKITSPHEYRHPISKGYGGEYATIINSDGSGYFYYGTQGGNGFGPPYFGYFMPPGSFPPGVWTHCVITRDFTNKIVRVYLNKRLILQRPTHGTAAAVSTASVQIGNSTLWTNYRFAGLLDEVIIANQAWSPQAVAALYDKGVAGTKANVSGSGSAQRLVDSGPGARHAFTGERSLVSTRGRTVSGDNGNALFAGGSSFVGSSGFTIEAVVYPKCREMDEALIFSNRAELIHSASGVRAQGAIEFGYTAEGTLQFRFDTASATVEFRQTSGERMRFNARNHIAVSHTFGAGGNTLLVVNGSPVVGRWVGGGGSETPTLLTAAPTFSVGPGDEIAGIRVSNVAKTITQIREHLRGRA